MKKENYDSAGSCDLQKVFTAYVTCAIQRQRQQHFRRMERRSLREELQDTHDLESSITVENAIFAELPLLMRIENDALLCALKELTERERDIFLSRVLGDKPFEEVGAKYGLQRKSVAMAYYRVVEKIRHIMEEYNDRL